MKNPSLLAIPALVIVGLVLILFGNTPQQAAVPQAVTSFLDSTYTIDGNAVTLVNGHATSSAALGAAAQVVTSVFGQGAMADLNGDGKDDAALLLTQNAGGSGTFYYVVAGIQENGAYTGTNAILLGDRIAPQTLQIKDGTIIVNYADRPASAPMTEQPSVGISKYLKVVNGQLVEASPSAYIDGNLLLGRDSSAKLGTYLIGSSGMTLYASNKDASGVSNCNGTCAETWAPYTITSTSSLANVQAGIPGKVDAATRADGSLQVTYNGAPLYFYSLDAQSGDTLGNGVNGQWSVVKP